MRALERTRTLYTKERTPTLRAYSSSAPRKIGESRCPLSWLRGKIRRCIKCIPCAKIFPSCVSRFILIPVIYTMLPKRVRWVRCYLSSVSFLRWLCPRNASGSSVVECTRGRWFVEKSLTCSENREIDWWTCYKREVKSLTAVDVLLTRRTWNTFFTLLNI